MLDSEIHIGMKVTSPFLPKHTMGEIIRQSSAKAEQLFKYDAIRYVVYWDNGYMTIEPATSLRPAADAPRSGAV